MTLTYIFHSGFVLETEHSILVFDYWLDPSGVLEGVLRKEKRENYEQSTNQSHSPDSL